MKKVDSKQLDLFAAVRPEKSTPDPFLDEVTLLKALADTRREVRNLTVIAMRPNPPEKAELLRNLERSARAEVKLRIKALAYFREQQLRGMA
jgi:hypothetical protein